MPKTFGVALKLLKTIKAGTALIAVAAYSLVFSWKFAAALVFMVLVHEYGHVFAMWRSGVAVKAIYFIPFLGGAAVGKGVARDRRLSAYIALNGPVWGTLLAVACLGGYSFAGEAAPTLGAMAAWGALINLFNLLPILPLDGGRILTSLSYSLHGAIGAVAVFCSLLLGATLAWLLSMELLVIMLLVGAMEYGAQLAAIPYGPGIRLIGPRVYGAAEQEHFHRMVQAIIPGSRSPSQVQLRADAFDHLKRQGLQSAMPVWQAALFLLGTFGLIGTLVVVVAASTWIPGVGDPLELLR